MRRVIVLFGPPGSGKTTAAHQAPPIGGMPPAIYDRDDPRWTSERQFTAALTTLAHSETYAIVVRTGATSAARAKTLSMVNATHAYMLDAPRAELERRVRSRGRSDMKQCLAALARWDQRSDRADSIPPFTGWREVNEPNRADNVTQRDNQRVTVRDL